VTPGDSVSTGGAAADAEKAVRALFSRDQASRMLGIEILSIAPGCVRTQMTVRPDMANGHDICHGGILFTMADSAFAYACNSHGESMVGAAASIEFLAPARVDDRLTATAVETHRSERHGIYDVVIATAAGRELAHFRGRCARRRSNSATAQL
jgi:acyl-CoA thioesterase